MKLWQERKRTLVTTKGRADREEYDRQTAWVAGTEFFQYRDPLYHVYENFMMNFDAMGRKHAAETAGTQRQPFPEVTENGRTTQENSWYPDPTTTRPYYERRDPMEQGMLRKFSETAFQRGTLSGAVLQGTGQMMLFSCLKKTIGQNQPDKWQQRMLFEEISPMRNLPGYGNTRMIFNRGFTDSAVGVVINTLRDARRSVEDMQVMLRGNTEMGTKPASTLKTMYPFLDDVPDKKLLSEYREKLKNTPANDPDSRAALQNAIVRLESLVAKKAQMKNEFINKLRFLTDRANEALNSFTDPGFPEALYQALEYSFQKGRSPFGNPPEEPPFGEPPEEPPEEGEEFHDGEPTEPGEEPTTGEPTGAAEGAEPGGGPASDPDPQR